jgi:hypothetical protein
MRNAHARTIRLTQQPKENIIPSTRSGAPQGGRHQIGTPAGFGSEQVAGFRLECMAGFVGIRTRQPSHVINGSFKVSAPPLLCGRRVAGTASTADAPKTVGLRPTVLARCLMAGMAGVDPAGTAASGLLLQAFYTVPGQYQQSLGDRCAHCRVLRTLPALGHSIARRSLDEVPSP